LLTLIQNYTRLVNHNKSITHVRLECVTLGLMNESEIFYFLFLREVKIVVVARTIHIFKPFFPFFHAM